jgi:hypothetical protein
MDTIFNISALAIKIGRINAHTGELMRSTMQHQDALQRKLPERIFHAVCFEGIATAILAPTAAWLMQRSVVEMGG